ncbi:hypothetical protein KC19_5G159500 [Ceratodon purpureus]|uniref:Protein kinase domain-containing protein n=1 Tax=Ceratodon purpureus TaxID=3225 RepID=A0A8T0I4K2_CERPU|nr:hypothetical protein KC19_5G159500 [Ceratodon purpureus]
MSKPGSTSESLLDLCKHSVGSIQDLEEGGILLNRKQCQDLSSKLSQIITNIEELVTYSGASIVSFGPALEKLYRCLEKAKLLVTNCAEEDWCAAAVFQCQNENAFREILLDVSFCYNAIYEQAKRKRTDWNDPPQDLRQCSLFDPATDGDALEDRQDLKKRLDELASAPTKLEGLDNWIPGRVSRKQSLAKCLANYLLVKMYFTSKEPLANNLDRHSPILWKKGSEPSGTWGIPRFLGSGGGASGVCGTTWLGVRCAKKEFHDQEFEGLFLKEAGISARMKHPSVINFISCGNGSEKGDRFIAMEHMQMNLYNLIEKQKGKHFSVAVAVDMMVQMARGVWYLHGQGVAHRDLKPQNVVVNRLTVPHVEDHYCVKLVDFGGSKTEVEVYSKLNTMTYRGIGTIMYRAPEAHRKANEATKGIGKVNWFKADAFSFAMTCAHLLSLETPFQDTMPNFLYGDLNEGSRPEVPDMYPTELISILGDCWETDPRSRPSFARICTRLEEFQLEFLMGYVPVNKEMKEENIDVGEGFEYIRVKLGTSTKGPLDNGGEDQSNRIDNVAIISCFKNMSMARSTSESLLDICKHSVGSLKDLQDGGILLNRKQCQDLSSKLSVTIRNVEELISYSGAHIVSFGPALERLYRCLEKANLLVTNCAEKDWCAAAVFQCQNENAFREILLDVGFCYNAIYEQVKTKRKDWNDPPQDLRQCSLFDPATDGDALEDKQDLQKKLDALANTPFRLTRLDNWIPGRECLANYLLDKMCFTSKEPLANKLDRHSPILWLKEFEPPGTWGNSYFLGSGGGASGVCGTTWLGVRCAKKEFHDQEFEDLFLKEAGISARMKHPSVIDFISCGNGSEKGDRFIAMEHMQMNLYNLIEKQKGEHFSVAAAVDMMVQMARGVWYLHGQRVAHRDLKPQNVVVNLLTVPNVGEHYCVKLVDFGVSKTEVQVSKLNTMTYRGIGTTMYRAPEAHPKANEATKGIGKVNWFKADAFSFAMTCAHLLCLERPKDTKLSDLFGDLNKGIRPIRPKVPDVYPTELISILEDCWHTDPRARPSFARICTRLEEFQLKFLVGYITVNKEMKEESNDVGGGIEYIKMKLGHYEVNIHIDCVDHMDTN